jgi:predicted ATPase
MSAVAHQVVLVTGAPGSSKTTLAGPLPGGPTMITETNPHMRR